MKNNRRDFLKLAGLAGVGFVGSGTLNACAPKDKASSQVPDQSRQSKSGRFNMSGYAAPALDIVRIGFIGVGNRGSSAVKRINKIENVEIKALSDLVPERVQQAKEGITDSGHNPALYSGNEEEWKKLCDREDVDLVYIATPWDLHVPMAVYAMEQGKHVAVEVPAALTVEECWQLVETSERTRKHCMMLENCCYDFFELLTLNMARQGFFGDIIHGEGAYIHDRMHKVFDKEKRWRLDENVRNGNLYPTHGLGPIAQVMDINRGDKMDYMVSVSSNDYSMGKMAKELAESDEFWEPYANKSYRGNINTSTIRTNNGRTIMIQHDVSSPRPYSRIHLISGTKGIARKWPEPARIATGHEWLSKEEFNLLEEKYQPAIIKKMGTLAKRVGGHGGMDFLMDWRLIDCLRNGLPLDMDVYDAASWSVITPLSEWSVANRSNSIDIPDFTAGNWKTNEPVDILLEKGGTTKVKV